MSLSLASICPRCLGVAGSWRRGAWVTTDCLIEGEGQHTRAKYVGSEGSISKGGDQDTEIKSGWSRRQLGPLENKRRKRR